MRWPTVPILFCETRALAQEWTYRFLAAAVVGVAEDELGAQVVGSFAAGLPLPERPVTPAEVRARALAHGVEVSDKGRVPRRVMDAFFTDHPDRRPV